MDICLFIVIGLAVVLFAIAVSRAGFSTGDIGLKSEGWSDLEMKRWLREAQKQERLEKARPDKPEPVQTETAWPLGESLKL